MRSLFTYKIILVVVLTIFSFNYANGQEKDVRDKATIIFLNVHTNGNLLKAEGYSNSNHISDTWIGGFGGAKAGISFKYFSLFLQFESATFKNDRLNPIYAYITHVSGGAGFRVHLPSKSPTILPYLEAGINAQYFSPPEYDDNWFGYFGSGPSFGGGMQYFFYKTLALDISLTHTIGNYESESMDLKSNNTQLSVGLSWYPFGN